VQNVRVVCARLESWAEGLAAFDLVTARALAPLPVVVEYAGPLLIVGGTLVVWRGRRHAPEEEAAARAAAEVGLEPRAILPVQPYPSARARHLHLMSKVMETPDRFPRRPGMALKRPLGVR
jgi:16S rRNA (guanine527-N7)-methyltransferase